MHVTVFFLVEVVTYGMVMFVERSFIRHHVCSRRVSAFPVDSSFCGDRPLTLFDCFGHQSGFGSSDATRKYDTGHCSSPLAHRKPRRTFSNLG
jgi:hypothetical protein